MVFYIGKSLIYKEGGGEVGGKDSKQSPNVLFIIDVKTAKYSIF